MWETLKFWTNLIGSRELVRYARDSLLSSILTWVLLPMSSFWLLVFSFSAYLYSQLGLTSLLERFTYQFLLWLLTSHLSPPITIISRFPFPAFFLQWVLYIHLALPASTSLTLPPRLQLFTSYFLSPISYFPLPNFFWIPSSHFPTYLSDFPFLFLFMTSYCEGAE